ncbi:MAG TPA: hypothetical protein VMU53_18695 [Candidatus Sulfotelmatobacter sp.]|nr:hypothetical protein [Candidatus Sulfotelmatobacter sp.]
MRKSSLFSVAPSLLFAPSKGGVIFGCTLCDGLSLPGHFCQFAKHWTEHTSWDYYGYHEDSDSSCQDLYAPSNFQANLMALSVRCAF